MRRCLAVLVAALAFIPLARAEEDPPPTEGKKAFLALRGEYVAKAQAAGNDKEAILEVHEKFAPRFLALAEKYPKDGISVFALWMCAQMSRSGEKGSPGARALELLAGDRAAAKEMRALIRPLAERPDAASVLAAIVEKNGDRKTQGRACLRLAEASERHAVLVKDVRSSARKRGEVTRAQGRDFVKALLAHGDRYEKDAERYRKLYEEKYASVVPDLAIGKKAPEVVSRDLDGKPVKLSDYRGKVVVLDIWATWCGPCVRMIPHEQKLVERLRGKPFALIGISGDAKRETLEQFVARRKMPWVHWWNGQRGGVLEDWDVTSFPTIYVLDHKGVIRYKGVRYEAMDEAVDALLEELEREKK
jgi:thiol-disulfide isomerase/thioredoxin